MSQIKLLKTHLKLSGQFGHCPTIEELARALDQSTTATRDAILRAIDAGFIERRDGHRGYVMTPSGRRIAGGS